MLTLISLVGDQPAPNVLPLRFYKPDKVVLVHTARTATLAGRIADVVDNEFLVQRPFCITDPYRVRKIHSSMEAYLHKQGLWDAELIFNLTGGTKTMAFVAMEIARQLDAMAFYYQTEDNQSLIHPYHFEGGEMVVDKPFQIPQNLILADYLRLYVGKIEPNEKPPDPFEKKVYQTLKVAEDQPRFEIIASHRLSGLDSTVEVDTLARLGNQIAVLEVKRKGDKAGIDQLNSATHLLGTYVRKILVSSSPLRGNNPNLAQAYGIKVIVLESGHESILSESDKQKLVAEVKSALEPRK